MLRLKWDLKRINVFPLRIRFLLIILGSDALRRLKHLRKNLEFECNNAEQRKFNI